MLGSPVAGLCRRGCCRDGMEAGNATGHAHPSGGRVSHLEAKRSSQIRRQAAHERD
jgi:hypothetical protein